MVLVRFDKDKKEWIEIPREQKQEGDLYLDRNLMNCLIHFKKQQKKDNDIVLIIEGMEGSGKSSLQGSILEFISDGDFNPVKDLVGADYLDGLEKIEKVRRGKWLGFDEGNSFFLATDTTTKQHKDLHKIFSIFRQKNLFVTICLPSFFRLGTYFAMDRSCGLARTYFKNGERGYFAFYGRERKDKLYRIGKATYNSNVVKPIIRGRFTKCHKLENEEYKAFKLVTLSTEINKAKEKFKKPKSEWEIRNEIKEDMIKKNLHFPTKELSSLFEVGERQIQRMKREIKQGIPAQ